ncbi:hypothetical protein KSF_107700 [Reticulibacter mediterranei]|uniref:Uncharacterized protein n=1 Tax=Reticulibacter mediterranei TaxID=2778369 RepID=A0A8J3J1P1_9CHLR|nr:hypothetical protein [Reticulibacter mediterranei]GHP00723.1 hypothetical protein KSF_107700 [Reticulibacter mediterranei]
MNDFERSVGYRSVWMNDEWPSKTELQQLPSEKLAQLTRDYFDYELAEILRSTGEWHWELDEDRLGDIASEVAARLSDSQEGWNDLYTLLRTYYEEQYRTPGKEELQAVLNSRARHEILVSEIGRG